MKIFVVIGAIQPKGSKSFTIVDKMACFVLGRDLRSDT